MSEFGPESITQREIDISNEDSYSEFWFNFLNIFRQRHVDSFPQFEACNNHLALMNRKYDGLLSNMSAEENKFSEVLEDKESAEWSNFERHLILEEIILVHDGVLNISQSTLEKLLADDWSIPISEQELIFQSRYERYLPDLEPPIIVD